MNAPLVEGEPVLIIWVLIGGTTSGRGPARHARYQRQRVQRAVVSSSVIDSVVQARERPFGRNLRPLTPGGEGISWCRGWSPEARDALLAAWSLYRNR